MLSLSLALMVSATTAAPATELAPPASHDHGDHAALVVAQDDGAKEGAKEGAKASAGDKAKKPGAGVLKGKELGMMERFAPFTVTDDAVKPVKDNLILVHVLGCLPLGGLWAPLLLYPSEGRPELGSDQLLSYLIPFAATWVAVMAIWVAAIIPSFVIPFCGFIGCLGCPVAIAGWWVSNNASMNAWDRAYKGKSIAGLPPDPHPGSAVAMAY